MHRQYINEWKSINHDVMQLSRYVAGSIWRDSLDNKVKLSKMEGKPYIEGNVRINVSDAFVGGHNFGVDSINVRYVMYMLDSYDDLNVLLRLNRYNSSADIDNSSISIFCYTIKGKIHPDFIGDIYHEIEHVFQYGVGMEKRAELYHKAIEGTKDMKDDVRRTISYLIYFTFPHEQDAFANQFFGQLKGGKFSEDVTSEELIFNETEYARYYNCLRMYKSYGKEYTKHVRDILNDFGLSNEQFNKRIHYGGKRLKAKLLKVFQRYQYEKSFSSLKEGRIATTVMNEIRKEYLKRYNGIEYDDEYLVFERTN